MHLRGLFQHTCSIHVQAYLMETEAKRYMVNHFHLVQRDDQCVTPEQIN